MISILSFTVSSVYLNNTFWYFLPKNNKILFSLAFFLSFLILKNSTTQFWSINWLYYPAKKIILYFDHPLLVLVSSMSSQSFKNILNYVLWGRTYLLNDILLNICYQATLNLFVIHITCFYHFVTPFYSIDNTLKMNSLIIEVKKGSISTC